MDVERTAGGLGAASIKAALDQIGAYVAVLPAPTGVVATDTANLQAAIDAAAAGATLIAESELPYVCSELLIDKAMTFRSLSHREGLKIQASGTGANPLLTVDPGVATTAVAVLGLNLDLGNEPLATGLKVRNLQRGKIDVSVRLGAVGVDIADCGSCDFDLRCTSQTTAQVLLDGDGGLEHTFNVLLTRTVAGTTAAAFHLTRTTTTDTGGVYFTTTSRITNSVGTMTVGVLVECSGGTTTMPLFFPTGMVVDGATTDYDLTNVAQVFWIGNWQAAGTTSVHLTGGSDYWLLGTKLKALVLDLAPAAIHLDDNTFSGTPGITVDAAHPPTVIHMGAGNRFLSTVCNDMAVLGAALVNGSVTGAAVVEIDPKHTPVAVVGTWALSANGSQIGGGYLRNSTAAQNDRADFYLPPMQPGTWTFELLSITVPAGGIITVQLDDGAGNFTTIGTIDTYSSGTVFNVLSSLTGVSVPAVIGGKRTIRFLMATKNASSSNYQANLTHMRARKTA